MDGTAADDGAAADDESKRTVGPAARAAARLQAAATASAAGEAADDTAAAVAPVAAVFEAAAAVAAACGSPRSPHIACLSVWSVDRDVGEGFQVQLLGVRITHTHAHTLAACVVAYSALRASSRRFSTKAERRGRRAAASGPLALRPAVGQRHTNANDRVPLRPSGLPSGLCGLRGIDAQSDAGGGVRRLRGAVHFGPGHDASLWFPPLPSLHEANK